jgi:hypothetical protein
MNMGAMYFCKYAKTLAYFPNIDTWYSKSDGISNYAKQEIKLPQHQQ